MFLNTWNLSQSCLVGHQESCHYNIDRKSCGLWISDSKGLCTERLYVQTNWNTLDPSPFAEYEKMAKVMGSKNPLTTSPIDDDLYGVTPAAYHQGKGTILPVHMAVRARYSVEHLSFWNHFFAIRFDKTQPDCYVCPRKNSKMQSLHAIHRKSIKLIAFRWNSTSLHGIQFNRNHIKTYLDLQCPIPLTSRKSLYLSFKN